MCNGNNVLDTHIIGPYMPGRIEYYIHSCNGTENKGASLVEITCQTEEGAKHSSFKEFAKEVATLAYVYQASDWEDICCLCPPVRKRKESVEQKIKEKIEIKKIVVMNLADNNISFTL